MQKVEKLSYLITSFPSFSLRSKFVLEAFGLERFFGKAK